MSNPIIFLPGVMGSRLYFPTTGHCWDPDSKFRMARWAPLWPFRSDDDNRRLFHFQEPAGVLIDAPHDHSDREIYGWGGVVWAFYGEHLVLLSQLATDGKAFAIGFDWRQDLRWLGKYAAEKILLASKLTGSKVSLVAHSMGGFVLRAAFKSEPKLAECVEKVVFICQPVFGSVALYRRLFTGLVPEYDGGSGLAGMVYRSILGNNRAGFIGNVSGQPGTLALLPNVSFPRTSEGEAWHGALSAGLAPRKLYSCEDPPLCLSDPTSHPNDEVRAEFQMRLLETIETHEWLGAPVLPDAVDTWQIVGIGLPTEVGVRFENGKVVACRAAEGDDSVPPMSASGMQIKDPNRTIKIADLSHATACQDKRVLDQTRLIFSD